MRALDWMFLLAAISGVCFGLAYWIELRRWAHLIKYGRIVVAQKGKVRLQGTLQEWALWCRASEQDKEHQHRHGREVYSYGGTRIAVLHKSFVPDTPLKRLLTRITRPEGKKAPAGKRAADGTWQVASDETKPVKVNGD